jgi:hypothetical protein
MPLREIGLLRIPGRGSAEAFGVRGQQGTRRKPWWRGAGSVGAEDVYDEDQGVGALDPGL